MLPAVQKYTLTLTIVFSALFQYGITAAVNETPLEDLKNEPKYAAANVILGDNVYYIGMFDKVNWHRATQICAYQGMTLAKIATDADNVLLQKYLKSNGILEKQFWLSANDLAKTKDFSWLSDGSPLLYTNWANAQPGCTACLGHCVRTVESFQWTVAKCDADHYFICMEPVRPLCGIRDTCKKRI